MSESFASWGRVPRVSHAAVRRLYWRTNPIPVGSGELILPRGMGRSYGDSCLNEGQVLLHTIDLDHFLDFDANTGVLHCEAGLTLKDILDFAIPRGWFLPVTPGTKFVTVGGAIANDVHGKNHHRAGTFGNHVLSFVLRRSTGELIHCSPQDNGDLFAATIGGLGLTGLILSARIRLIPIGSPYLTCERLSIDDLDEFFSLSNASEAGFDYTVAWIDCTAGGSALGKGVFMRANHAPAPPAGTRATRDGGRISVPFDVPGVLLNQWSVSLFNKLYYRAQIRRRGPTLERYESFFYPLDSISRWNRIYGKRGFYQYQCVIPGKERDALKEVLREIAAAGGGSFLSVLKVFGNVPSPGMMSFPRPGPTLALDFPNRGQATLSLFERLDDIVFAADGALYPAKDARMSGRMFRQSFPCWEAFSRFVDPAFSSSFWRRVTRSDAN
jgi:FAD/FMN-containing dehydrogenase